MNAVSVSEVRVQRSGATLLAGVDLDVREGEFLALVGANGAGKSTLVRVLAGILTPVSGSVQVFGRAWSEWDRQERARAIAYLPQEPQCHWPFSVRHVLALGASRGFGALARAAPPPAVLHDLRVAALLDRRIDTLSGGERARVFLAAALAGSPRLLLADEPTASLDPAHQIRLLTMLRQQTTATTAVVVLHDLNLALRFADRIAVMADGRCVGVDTPEVIIASGVLARAFGIDFATSTCGGRTVIMPTQVNEEAP